MTLSGSSTPLARATRLELSVACRRRSTSRLQVICYGLRPCWLSLSSNLGSPWRPTSWASEAINLSFWRAFLTGLAAISRLPRRCCADGSVIL